MKSEEECLMRSARGVLDDILINIDPGNLMEIKQVVDSPMAKKFFADEELILTVQTFFDNDLNLMQTSKQLIVHRNTLIYRLEKIKKMLGLDIRKFDDAVTLHVLLVLKRTEIKRKRHNNKKAQLLSLKKM